MHLNWIKCEGDQWCSFLNVNLDHSHFLGLEGVYVIWHVGQQPATVYVGQGAIKSRLDNHRHDDDILKFSHYGLFVTWAKVEPHLRGGVERFLAENLKPIVGKNHPRDSAIAVNFPW